MIILWLIGIGIVIAGALLVLIWKLAPVVAEISERIEESGK
jgi:hypothetical protein